MLTTTTPYHKPLGNGLALKSIATREDVERLAVFNNEIHGHGVDAMTRALILNHPHTQPEHWIYVEEEATGRIVSSLCLLPWRWNYAGVELRSGEMGICGTLPEFRNRGLVRILMARHKELLAEGGFHISNIQGIPYFYRQFDYEYAIPLEGGWLLDFTQIPDTSTEGFSYRLAAVKDIPALMQMYEATERQLDLSAMRDADEWRFMLEQSRGSATEQDFFLLLDAVDHPVGFWGIQRGGFGDALNVCETSQMSPDLSAVALSFLKGIAVERGKPNIRLLGSESSSMIQTALVNGAQVAWKYAWQIHIPDAGYLLKAIAPVLEKRIAESAFAGLTRTVIINLYKKSFAVHFEADKVSGVDALGFTGEGDLHSPPLVFAPLVFGWRSREELDAIYPDFGASGESAALIDVLFPKLDAFLYTVY